MRGMIAYDPVGPARSLGIAAMNNYSIVRIGNEYVVQANDKSVLKVASRRRAAKLVSAAELLDSQIPPQTSPDTGAGSSITCDPGVIPDPHEVP
jgi:hypothetical protein